MLAAAERWGGGRGRAPLSPARLLARPPARRRGSISCSRTSGRARGASASCAPGEELWVLGPLGRGFRARRARARRAILVGGGVGIAPLAILQDRSRGAAHARAARLPRRARTPPAPRCSPAPASPPTTARSATTGSSPSCSPRSSTRDAHAVVYACGPAPMLEAVRAMCAERERAGAARAGGGHGVRLRRLLRLRRAAPRRGYLRVCVDGPVRRRGRARATWRSARRRRGAAVSVELLRPRARPPGDQRLGHLRRDRRAARASARSSPSGFPSRPLSPRRSPCSRARATRRRGCGRPRPG